MSQHWKSLLVVLVIIGAIVFLYRGNKEVTTSTETAPEVAATTEQAPEAQASTTPEVAQVQAAPEAAMHTTTA